MVSNFELKQFIICEKENQDIIIMQTQSSLFLKIRKLVCRCPDKFLCLPLTHNQTFTDEMQGRGGATDIHQRSQNLRHLDPGMGLKLGVFAFFP